MVLGESYPIRDRHTPPPEKPLRFFDLPWEIRRNILLHTNLVNPNVSNNGLAEVKIRCSLRIKQFYLERHDEPAGSAIWVPYTLFRVSKKMRDEALEVLFLENRVRLDCTFSQGLRWLKSVPRESLNSTRKLDIHLRFEQSLEEFMAKRKTEQCCKAFEDLITFVAAHCRKERLFLSLITGDCLLTDGWMIADFASVVVHGNHYAVWTLMADSVKRHLCPGLARFQVFDAMKSRLETGVEKFVMGEEYDSAALSKIPQSLRDFTFPRFYPHIMGPTKCRKEGSRWRASPEDDGEGAVKAYILK